MKRWIGKFFVISVCLMMLCGCGQTLETSVSEDDIVSSEANTYAKEENPVIEITAEGVSEEEPSASETLASETSTSSDPVLALEDTILQARSLWAGSTNLFEVPLTLLDGVAQSEVHRFGDDLLLAYSMYDRERRQSVYVVKLVSIENGEELYTQQLGALTYGVVQILDHHVAINDLGDGKCYLLNEALELVSTYDLSGGKFCLDQKGEKAYLFTYDQGVLEVDLASGQSAVLLEYAVNVYLCEANGEQATFVYTDTETLLRCGGTLDLRNGQIRTLESPYAYSWIEAGRNTWLGMVDADAPMYVVSDGTSQGMFYQDWSSMVGVNHASGHVMISEMTQDGEAFFAAYDGQGQCISDCRAEDVAAYPATDFAWFAEYNGYVFTLMDDHGQDHLMFWDVSVEDTGKDLDLVDVSHITETPRGTAVSQELYEQAEMLSEKYGVTILIADQCEEVFTDHNADLLLAEAEIRQALQTLDHVLGRYPDGFFAQLRHNTYKSIEIQVLGQLKKSYSTEENIYISGGFVTTAVPGKLVMALDARAADIHDEVNAILAGTMYHEFSHMIDKRLSFGSQYRSDALYSDTGWEALNPVGFEYNETYYGTLDPQYVDYFVDAYACTNGTEDRARVMEYAMAGEVSVFAAKPGLIEKLAYYCRAVRDGFDTTGWPEVLPWEETLRAAQ